ncbi:MAG: sorbosone dehydrogenase family protein [Steroidobacteraceae bacterium]
MLRAGCVVAAWALVGCTVTQSHAPAESPASSLGAAPVLPAPQSRFPPTLRVAVARGWPAGAHPAPAPGLVVQAFASGLSHPRWLHVLPNGDVLVAATNAPPRPQEGRGIRGAVMKSVQARAGAGAPSANRIRLLRDADGDGRAETMTVYADALNSPFGMALVGSTLYVARTDAVIGFDYREGDTAARSAGRMLASLPAGPRNHHWTKNILASADGRYLYATVGSNSNVAENGLEAEQGRAAIWRIEIATGRSEPFATGLRNPNGLALDPESGALWAVVNERDELGNDLVPDYLTAVRQGAFYGWPWSYFGPHVDQRVRPPDPQRVASAVKPDYALGAHVAALGLTASQHNALGGTFQRGMFIGEHGSWNRNPAVGYKVVFIRFAQGQPLGLPADVLTGFVDAKGRAQGRPVGVAMARDGALLVADDVGNTIWRVTAAPAP